VSGPPPRGEAALPAGHGEAALPEGHAEAALLAVRGVTLAFGPKVIQHDLSFDVRRGSIFAVMGGSGCGKSTVLKSMIGLLRPAAGSIRVENEDYWGGTAARRTAIGRRFGVLFQSGALWSALTVGENVALPLRMFTTLNDTSIRRLVRLKLGLVGMERAIDQLPSELSGGMRKRAGLARALALDPDVLFFDEPSAGLDPITSSRLDDLILNLRDGLGATIVIVSHELPSLFAIADDGVFLDAETRTAIAYGSPSSLRDNCPNPQVEAFMRRERPEVLANRIQPSESRPGGTHS
jgi:phospholipid/cholesterol/gamma-HCH transport system ATP-binding protein